MFANVSNNGTVAATLPILVSYLHNLELSLKQIFVKGLRVCLKLINWNLKKTPTHIQNTIFLKNNYELLVENHLGKIVEKRLTYYQKMLQKYKHDFLLVLCSLYPCFSIKFDLFMFAHTHTQKQHFKEEFTYIKTIIKY